MATPPQSSPAGRTVLVYSEDPAVRERVRMAAGRRPAPELGRVQYLECDTGPAVIAAMDRGGVDLAVLDGEAWPTGGLGISRELKNSLADCPPVLVLIGRRDDRWLAQWSQADAVLAHPLDAVAVAGTVGDLLRRRAGDAPSGPGTAVART